MCKLRRCLATARRWQLAALAAVVLVGGLFFVDYLRAGTLVLELRTEPVKRQPRIQVEIFSDDPATEHCVASVFRRLYSGVREPFFGPEPRWINAHHNTEKVEALRPVASEWIKPGERREFRLKPGRYLLSREIHWGWDGESPAHGGFEYRTIEIKAGERIEINDLLDGWDR